MFSRSSLISFELETGNNKGQTYIISKRNFELFILYIKSTKLLFRVLGMTIKTIIAYNLKQYKEKKSLTDQLKAKEEDF